MGCEKARLQVLEAFENHALERRVVQPGWKAHEAFPKLIIETLLGYDAAHAFGFGEGRACTSAAHTSSSSFTTRSAPRGSNSQAPRVGRPPSSCAISRMAK